jgi:hypothetical protein
MTKSVTEQVAREKERMSLRSGDSPERAARYAQEVRDYARREREQKGGKN